MCHFLFLLKVYFSIDFTESLKKECLCASNNLVSLASQEVIILNLIFNFLKRVLCFLEVKVKKNFFNKINQALAVTSWDCRKERSNSVKVKRCFIFWVIFQKKECCNQVSHQMWGTNWNSIEKTSKSQIRRFLVNKKLLFNREKLNKVLIFYFCAFGMKVGK